MRISDITTEAPAEFSTPTQALVYELLERSATPFRRVDNDPAITVESCDELSRVLDAPTVKTLLVANRQLTRFYLVVMPGDKPFVTRDFTAALGVSRVSFVKPELLHEMLGLEVGACTPLAIAADKGCVIRLIIDRMAVERPSMLIPDGTTTCYMSITPSDLLDRYLPLTAHTPEIVDM